jgi:DNA polymerase V
MGAPWHLSKQKFAKHGVIVRSSNYTLYGDLSGRVMSVLSQFTPNLEIYSIDEAFLGLAGFERRLHAHACDLRATVLAWTGIPVSVGIAPTKTLAKVANRIAKSSSGSGGVHVLMERDAQSAALERLALADLWGVAALMSARLRKLGCSLCAMRILPGSVRSSGSLWNEWFSSFAGSPVLVSPSIRSTIRASLPHAHSGGLSRPCTSWRKPWPHIERAAQRMRLQKLPAGAVSVFVHTNPFDECDPQYSATATVPLSVATADTARLLSAALHLTRKLWRDGYRYKKAGVMLLELAPAASVQGSLFVAADSDLRKALMRVLERLNGDYGTRAVHFAASGSDHGGRLRANLRSPRFTTCWEELLRVERHGRCGHALEPGYWLTDGARIPVLPTCGRLSPR